MTSWKNSSQVADQLELQAGTTESMERLVESLSISDFVNHTIPLLEGDIGDIGERICLTAYGTSASDKAFSSTFSVGIRNLACLSVFYHHDLLIDPEKTDLEYVNKAISNHFIRGNLRVPNYFERELYDKYNETTWADRTDSLSSSQVDELLHETQQGICQAGQFVAGPLGLIRSKESRLFLPPPAIPLWHCSDPGCNALHRVRLLKHRTVLERASQQLRNHLKKEQGHASDWVSVYGRLQETPRETRRQPYADLLPLISSSIPGEERTSLLAAALQGNQGNDLRSILRKLKSTEMTQGKHEIVASRLSAPEQLQILCTLSDRDLIRLIDSQIKDSKIFVPPSEIRMSVFKPPGSRYTEYCQISNLGVRSMTESPPALLSSVIYNAYNEEGELSDLEWRVNSRDVGPESPLEYMRNNGPIETIRNLVLPSRRVASRVANALFADISNIDNNGDGIISKILWKAGFNVPRYDDKYVRFRTSLSNLLDIANSVAIPVSASNKELIRSAGVNPFVYLEEFLEDLISFNIWVLSSDHLVDTKYNYDRGAAVARVSSILGSEVPVKGGTVQWSLSGANTLGALLVYARLASKWFASLVDQDRVQFKRTQGQLPHFANWPDRYFPFHSVQLWADCDSVGLRDFAARFEQIVAALERSKAASIRNGLDHHRQSAEFPSVESIALCVGDIRAALDAADAQRFIPKTWWATETRESNYELIEITLKDYSGRDIKLSLPRVTIGLPEASMGEAFIISPGDLLKGSANPILFNLSETSPYKNYWSNYPRHLREKTLEQGDV